MSFGEIGLALGGGAFGAGIVAGIMKLVDRHYEHKLARKDKREDCANDHEERITALEQEKERREKTEQAMLKALYALLGHAMTGNATGRMQEAQERLIEFIIDSK